MGRRIQFQKDIFKKCGCCAFSWKSRDDFLGDPAVKIIGYQSFPSELMSGAFLFNHSCGTTLALKVGSFRSLYDGPVYCEHLIGEEECPEYCLREDSLEPCPERCECAYVREIIQMLRTWPKASASLAHP